jgi:hypothetical protein
MKPLIKLTLVFSVILLIVYALAFSEVGGGVWFLAAVLLSIFLVLLLMGKFAGFFLWRRSKTFRRGDSGPGDGPYPMVPRPPSTRPPALRAREPLPA